LEKNWDASILQNTSYEFYKVFGKVGDSGTQIQKINEYLVNVWGYDYTAMKTSRDEYSTNVEKGGTYQAVEKLKDHIHREFPDLFDETHLAFSCEICHPPCGECNGTNCKACNSKSSLFNSQTMKCGHFTRALISCIDILPDQREQLEQTLQEMKNTHFNQSPFKSIIGAIYAISPLSIMYSCDDHMEFWIKKHWAASLQIALHQPSSGNDFTIEVYEINYDGNDKITEIKPYVHNSTNGISPHQIVQINTGNIDLEFRNSEKFMCGRRFVLPRTVLDALQNPQINNSYSIFANDSDDYRYLFIEMEQLLPNEGPNPSSYIPKKNILWRLGNTQQIQVTLYDYHGPMDNGFGRRFGLKRPPGFGMKISSGDLAEQMQIWTDNQRSGGLEANINGQLTISAGLGILILWLIDISIEAFLRVDVKASLGADITELDGDADGAWFFDLGWQIKAGALGSSVLAQLYDRYSISRQNDLQLAWKHMFYRTGGSAIFPLTDRDKIRLGEIYRQRTRLELTVGSNMRVQAEFDMPDPWNVITYSEYKTNLVWESGLDCNGPYIRWDGSILGSPFETNPTYALSSWRLRFGIAMKDAIPTFPSGHMFNNKGWGTTHSFYKPPKNTSPKKWLKAWKVSLAADYYIQAGIQISKKLPTPKPLLDAGGNLVTFTGNNIVANPLGLTADAAAILTYLNGYVGSSSIQPYYVGIGPFARLGIDIDLTIPIWSMGLVAVTIKGGFSAYIDAAVLAYVENYSNALPSNVNDIQTLFDNWMDPNTTYDVKKLGFPKQSEIGPG